MKILPKSFSAKIIAIIFAIFSIAYGFYSISQSTPVAPNIAPVTLAADPLYAQGSGQKPTLTLALSVEFPTVGGQYRGVSDYTPDTEYIGYFDSGSCYGYNNATLANDRYFQRTGPATNRKCGGTGFSGNFMNWATSSSIDILRYGLTGGDRFIDKNNLTVLQRAILQTSFWNSGSYFPLKSISKAVATDAIPTSMFSTGLTTVYISNCLNQVFFSSSNSTGSCAAPTFTNSLGAKASSGTTGPAAGSAVLSTDMFFTRVKVCESSGNTLQDPRASLCQKYPNGYYKPVGNMQKYSDRVRLSAFGYLMDNGTLRYGGVLRAPMTYVGAKSYDANGIALSGINPYREWDSDTGIFIDNPRGDTIESNSGVINYLNKFGRVGATPGLYKSNDPVGELYYESLRYLQGLQPTAQAVSNITSTLRAGFPAYSTWTDPFDGGASDKNYSCLRNSILLIGDVNTHADKSFPGNTRTSNNDFNRASDVNLANNIPNFYDWTKVIGGFESGNSVTYKDANGTTRTSSNPTSNKNSGLWGIENQDTGSGQAAFYIAGAAYWAHTHDIRGTDWSDTTKRRPGMRVTTYVLDVNENGSNTTPSNRYKTQFFLTAKYGGFNDTDNDGNPFTPPNNNNQYDNRHWEKDTSPLEAKTYFLASDASAVLKALDDIFIAATKVSNTIAAPATSTNQLSTTDGYIYLASFDPEYWSGDLKRNTIKIKNDNSIEQGDPIYALSAAKKLDNLSDAQTENRKIFVGKSSGTTSGYATEFKWGSIESSLQDYLNKETPTATADGNGQNRLKFIRGYRELETSTFRKRGSRMGDIVNSGTAYSAVPTTRYSDTDYKTFFNNNKNRTKAVFVGANDGMLHAFNATTMDELFAYIPSWMGPNISLLTATDYNSSRHTSYVDATPTTAEAQLDSGWKTVLVSGTGGGGQGVFALDITDPTAFTASSVLWEFKDSDDPDIGNIVGQPKILKIRTSPKTATTKTYKWFAVVPSGANNYVNDGVGKFSTTGQPALFLLDLSKPTSTAWSLGTNYFKISLPISNSTILGTQVLDANGTGTGTGKATGLINFEATGDYNDAVQYFYFGDLHGQLWKIDMNEADLSSSNPSSWSLNSISFFKKDTEARPLYIAKSSDGKVQSISMTPTIAYGPSGTYILAFGTGKYLEATDNASSTQIQSFYTIYDNGLKDLANGSLARFAGRSNLQQGSISGSTISMSTFYWTDPSNTNTTTRKAGWFIDFPKSGVNGGERQVTNASLLGNQIIFSSLMPPSTSTNACGGGSSYTYIANLASGIGEISTVSSGAQGAPIIFKLSSDISVSDSSGLRTKTDKVILGVPSSTGDNKLSISETKTATSTVGRLSWRQINNYQELKYKSWE
ncbi:MAG: pilus assembly protein PilY [Burkholderiaceae bacterium]|nr:pilus assembly protein PilY [Burkholderiaceae bacterium]